MELIEVLVALYTTLPDSPFHVMVIMAYVAGLGAMVMGAISVSNLLYAVRMLILGFAYKMSPGMLASHTEVEKIEAEHPGLRDSKKTIEKSA